MPKLMAKSAKSVRFRISFKLLNQRGMSLAEVLVALAMVGILSMVIASVLETIQKSQRQTNFINTIEQLRTSIVRHILDKNSWANTINNADNMTAGTQCLADGTPTCNTSPAVSDPITLADAQANLIPLAILHDGAVTPGTVVDMTGGANGFNNNGAACTGFNEDISVGNDQCLIRYDLFLQFDCGATDPCANPTVTIYGILRYRPNPDSSLRSIVNESKYHIKITRGQGDNYLAENISVAHNSTGDTGGGSCNPGGWATVQLSDEEVDDGNNVTLGGSGVMTFLPGTYTCSATATCFACQTVRVRINIGGSAPIEATSPPAFAPAWITGQAILNGYQFTLNSATTLTIEQFCAQHPGGDSGLADLGMGMALPTTYSGGSSTYSGTQTFARITCTRTQ